MNMSKTLLCIYLIVIVHPLVAGLHISRLIVDDKDKFDIFDGFHVQAIQGQNITLIGWYDNLEAPIHMFNGKSIRKSEKYQMEWSENQLILTITNLTDKQTGLYSYYHPSLKSKGQLYLYVKSKNFFAPSESNVIFCDDPKICILPCRLNNYKDKENVQLYLDGKLQNSKYSSGVGYQIDRQQLNTNITVANATCIVHNEKASYIINFLDVMPSEWLIGLKINTSWPKLGDSVSIMCSVIVNSSYSGNYLNILLSVLHEGDAEFGSKCHIDSSKKSKLEHNGDVMVKKKEFSILSYTTDCRGKFICRVRNSSGRYFNKQSSAHLDQLEIISRTDAEVETVVGTKMNVAAKFRSPSKEGQLLLFNMSRVWEKVTCQGITCVITNETTTHVAFATENTTIDYSYDVVTQNSGWHQYSLGIYRSSELIQRLTWDIFVRGQVVLQHNCSELLLVPALCVFTTISYSPDRTIVFTTTEDGHEEILHPSSVNKMVFLTVKRYENFINTSVKVQFGNQYDKNPILLTVFAVELFYFVHSTFSNANAQDIYKGDSVTIKGRIALSNGSFLIQHRSDPFLCPSKKEKFPECTLRNFNSTSNQTFSLIWKNNIVASINIPATRKVKPPFFLNITTVYKSGNFILLTCPIGGNPIFYNWTVNGVLISGHSDQRLIVNTPELPEHYECCAMNRISSMCFNLREENKETTWIIVVNNYIIITVVVVMLSIVLSIVVIYFYVVPLKLKSQKSKVRATYESGEEEIVQLIGTEERHEAGAHIEDMTKAPDLRHRPNKNSTNSKVDDLKEIRQQLLMPIKTIADTSKMQIFAYQQLIRHIPKLEENAYTYSVELEENAYTYIVEEFMIGPYAARTEQRDNDIRWLTETVQSTSELDLMRNCCNQAQSALYDSFYQPYLIYKNYLNSAIVNGLNGSFQETKKQLENKAYETTLVYRTKLMDFHAMLRKL